jgi:hypothetical protein
MGKLLSKLADGKNTKLSVTNISRSDSIDTLGRHLKLDDEGPRCPSCLLQRRSLPSQTVGISP